MTALELLGDRLVKEVNWPVIVYIGLIIAGAVVLDKWAGMSVGKVFSTLLRELKDLAGKKFTAGSVNMVGVILMCAVVAGFILSPQIAEIISIAGGAKERTSSGDSIAQLFALALVAVTILGSVLCVVYGDRKR